MTRMSAAIVVSAITAMLIHMAPRTVGEIFAT
jgi:hypothetical protein